MFKALKEKVSNEYEKAKVNIQTQAQNLVNNGTINTLATTIGDNPLIGESSRSASKTDISSMSNDTNKSDASSKADTSLHYSEPGFSLVDLDEEHPRPTPVASSTPTSSKTHSSSDNDSFFRTNFFSNMVSNLVPQSDIESEYESEAGSSTRNLDSVSKEQLIELCYKLKERGRKYRERWGEVVKAYRTTIDERDKLKNVLGETQDRALRRVNELKEQCNLEQEAKRHLEENLQVFIEEKEDEIKVLRTKIDLINSTEKGASELIDLSAGENEEQKQKIANLEALLGKCNESLKSYKERVDVLTKEYEGLVPYKAQAEKLEKDLETSRKLKESVSASFTEAKQKLHDELESRSIIIKELKDQNEKKSIDLKKHNNELKNRNETIKTLNEKLSKLESTFESEKSTLMEELSRGKVAAINLLREEHEKRLQLANSEWEDKLKELSEQTAQLTEKMTAGSDGTELLQQQLEQTKQEATQLKSQLDEYRDKLSDAVKKLDTCTSKHYAELGELQGKIVHTEQTIEEQRSKIDELSNQLVELDSIKGKMVATERLLDEKELHRQEIGAELESVRGVLEQKEQAIERMNQEARAAEGRFNEQLEQHRVQLEQFKQSAHADGEIQELESRIETLKEKNRQKISKIGELEKALVGKDSQIIELSKEKSELENEIDAVKERLNSAGNDTDANVAQLRANLEKSEKGMAITKKLMGKLREDGASLQEEVTTLRAQCADFAEEKVRLTGELDGLNNEVIAFKNKLMDTFYSAYADSELGDIASLDYGKFLATIDETYKKTVAENVSLSKRIFSLEEALQKSSETSEQDRSKRSRQLEELQSTNLSLIEENEKLRKIEWQSKDLESSLQEKVAQLEAAGERVESLLSELTEVRQQLYSSKAAVKANADDALAKEEQLQKQQSEMVKLQRELSQTRELLNSASQAHEEGSQQFDQQLSQSRERNQHLEEELHLRSEKLATLTQQVEDFNRQNTIYAEEITKIKSNAKEILESKQKLKEKLSLSDSKLGALTKECTELTNTNKQLSEKIGHLTETSNGYGQERAQMEKSLQQLKVLVSEKEAHEKELQQKISELQQSVEVSLSHNEVINELEASVRSSNEKCIELEEKLKLRSNQEQKLRTEIISLEEKLKSNSRTEKEMKEQVHKYLSELNELKNEMETMKGKHEQAVDKLYKQLEVRETQLDESLMNANSQYNSTAQELIKSKAEVTRLAKLLEELTAANLELDGKLANFTQSNENSQKIIVQQYESQLEVVQAQLDQQKQEIAVKMDQFDTAESKLITEHKNFVAQLENEVQEKSAALEEVHEYYQQRLKSKDSELKHLHEQLTSTDKNNYQINALQNSVLQYHEENSRLKELLNVKNPTSDNGKTSTDMENCAILGVHLPQPTEYEYLRNILFEFMVGREPVTLAKVIAAVLKFTNEQTDQIIRKQEALQAHLKFNKPS